MVWPGPHGVKGQHILLGPTRPDPGSARPDRTGKVIINILLSDFFFIHVVYNFAFICMVLFPQKPTTQITMTMTTNDGRRRPNVSLAIGMFFFFFHSFDIFTVTDYFVAQTTVMDDPPHHHLHLHQPYSRHHITTSSQRHHGLVITSLPHHIYHAVWPKTRCLTCLGPLVHFFYI